MKLCEVSCSETSRLRIRPRIGLKDPSISTLDHFLVEGPWDEMPDEAPAGADETEPATLTGRVQ